jgi:phosphatidate cytidylyltransferase
MAFNRQTFQTRALTAIVFAVFMLVGLLWNRWSFIILFSIIHIGCWWEYLKLAEKIFKIEIDKVIKYFLCTGSYMLFLAIGFSSYTYDFTWTLSDFTISLKWALVVVLLISIFAFLFQNKQITSKAKLFIVFGFVYISLSIGLMLDIRNTNVFYIDAKDTWWDKGWIIPCIIIGSIWINDTMAYIVGSLIGKTPLSKISPKKTWEGTIGGIILSILVSSLVAFQEKEYAHGFITPWDIVIITVLAAITGTIGDLFESKLKRVAGVKDSGSFMRGHGGFLDRFDSLLLATPFVWIYVRLFMA